MNSAPWRAGDRGNRLEPDVSESLPEPWLRGPLGKIPASLLPFGHAFVAAREEVEAATKDLPDSRIWFEPWGAASIGFHLLHLAGSTDRLLSYARAEALSETQRAALAAERVLPVPRPGLEALLEAWAATVETALAQLERTPPGTLNDVRGVGRAQLPSTVRGLLAHAAEHARRHSGQIVTTAKIVRAMDLSTATREGGER